jgi:hypothetical protein
MDMEIRPIGAGEDDRVEEASYLFDGPADRASTSRYGI